MKKEIHFPVAGIVWQHEHSSQTAIHQQPPQEQSPQEQPCTTAAVTTVASFPDLFEKSEKRSWYLLLARAIN